MFRRDWERKSQSSYPDWTLREAVKKIDIDFYERACKEYQEVAKVRHHCGAFGFPCVFVPFPLRTRRTSRSRPTSRRVVALARGRQAIAGRLAVGNGVATSGAAVVGPAARLPRRKSSVD